MLALIPPTPTIFKVSPPISIVSISQPSRSSRSEQRQESPSSHKIISNNHPSSLLLIILSPAIHNTHSLNFFNEEFVCVLDPNTKCKGLVTFDAIQTPSGYNSANLQYPECMTKLPSSKAREILPPPGTRVGIYFEYSQRQKHPV